MRVAPVLCAVPRLLTHPSVQMLWRKYCSGDSVQASTFLSGVEQFLVRFENMDAASAAELMGPLPQLEVLRVAPLWRQCWMWTPVGRYVDYNGLFTR